MFPSHQSNPTETIVEFETMKTGVTICFALAFTQVVVGSKVRSSQRGIRQLLENADVGQLRQPPVTTSSAISQDMLPSLISFNNAAVATQNTQPAQTILAPSNATENEQLVASSLPLIRSQIPPNPAVATSTVSDFAAQIPSLDQSPSSLTPRLTLSNSTTTMHEIAADFSSSADSAVPAPNQMYSYDSPMTFGKSAAYPPTPFASLMGNPNTQQFSYNSYSPQYPMAYTNLRMMYRMPFPMQYTNYSRPSYINSTSPRSSSPYPDPPNCVQAPNTADESATPTIMSSTGETGAVLDSLPPQVKEFMDMIPEILSMHESSPVPNHEIKRPSIRKLPKVPTSSLLKKKSYYQSNYPSSAYSGYPQKYSYYY